ncbi:DEAD/DEAH box helicase [Arachnia propionica]|uniref:Lhr family helicase n=1 Tax=Arachnia propionica TaxID=1750 RepID=UPI0030CB75A5
MPMSRFSAPSRDWFVNTFGVPTPVQEGAWRAIADGGHVLVVAPTGSGKTLAAFLHALASLLRPGDRPRGTRVLYVSPLKALGVDVERNLRVPLAGIREEAERQGSCVSEVTIGVRSGDTPARDRDRMRRRPPDVLITTPESLYLMLTSSARDTLRDVETVIIDEIHAIAGSKRGTHLALSLERLDLLTGRDVQRVALSATVRPVEKVAAFLGGDRDVVVVAPRTGKSWDLQVATPPLNDPWPHVEKEILDAILRARSTLVFANSRRAAEKLTARLNELWLDTGSGEDLARAHHGSVSKHVRAEIEDALKAGRLRAVVATSSLELGIDMGAIDQVIQISAPLSTSSALQRFGRAGHQVGATSRGHLHTLHRGELAAAVVTISDMLAGRIEELRIPVLALDVLAQQTIAAAAAAGDAGLGIETWLAAVRRSHPYSGLGDDAFDAVLQLLLGTYPSADFSELRARLERRGDRLFALPGAGRLAVTIPDRGLYGVFLADGNGPGRRVGELDEEMVHETRVGETFTLGASSWTVVGITRDQVLVTPAPGRLGKLPFWIGEDLSRPAELGCRIGELLRRVAEDPDGLELPWADENTRRELVTLVTEQREATGVVPDERTVVVERFRDELSDWRIVVHSPLGRAVLAPWSVAVAALVERRSGVDSQPVATDDGFILRLPDGEVPALVADLARIAPKDVERLVADQVGGTSLFAARFRECASRALLLPRRHGRRMPLWQQRHRAAQLLQVARQHPNFPITLEAVRECLTDRWDLPGLTGLLSRIRSGAVRLVEVVTPSPSPFAASMLYGYAGRFMYEGDLPIAERRAQSLALDPALLASVLGTLDLRELLDPLIVESFRAELQHIADGYRARNVAELVDLPRRLGPLSPTELELRSEFPLPDPPPAGLVPVVIADEERLAAEPDLALLRDALGVAVPGEVSTETCDRDPLTQLIARFARTHTPFTAAALAASFGLGRSVASRILESEADAGRLVRGRFTEDVTETEYCDPGVLDRLRGRCLAAARAAVEPVSAEAYTRFLLDRHGVTGPRSSSPDEVLLVLQQLAGAMLPASVWESHVLPARVAGYQPSHLDQLLAEGEVLIRLRGAGADPLLTLVATDDLDLLPPPSEAADEESVAFAAGLGDGLVAPGNAELVWRAAAAGLVAPASMAPIRALLTGESPRHSPRSSSRFRARRPRPARPISPASRALPGRWYAVTDGSTTPTEARLAQATGWLERYGVVTRGIVEGTPGGFAAAYGLLRELEDSGLVRRGVLVDGLGAAQFAAPETIDALRSFREPDASAARVLAAVDPANPFGRVLPWPAHNTARPSRLAGAVVVIADGTCLAYLGRAGRSLTLFPSTSPAAEAARVIRVLGEAVSQGRMARFRIEEIDGARATAHPLASELRKAGAGLHPQGLVVEAAPTPR